MRRDYSSGDPNPNLAGAKLVSTIGSPAGGAGPLEFNNPSALAADHDGNLLIADTGNHRVVKLDAQGGLLWSVGGTGSDGAPSPGTAQAEFNSPQAVCTDTDNNIYVADTRNNRIQKLSPESEFITMFGAWGNERGQFGGEGPLGVAVDDRGFVLVTDSHTATGGNHRVQRFDSDGDFVGQFGSYGTGPGQFGGALPVREYGYDFGPDIGPGPIGPAGVAVNTNEDLLLERNNRYGDIFVADCDNDRVHMFQGTEMPITTLGVGTVRRPRQVAVDASDRVYVSGVHRHAPAVAVHDINDPFKWRVEAEHRWVWVLDPRGMFYSYGTVLGGLPTPEVHAMLEHRQGVSLHSHGYGIAVSKTEQDVVFIQGDNMVFKLRLEWEAK